jgi:hypothetical protein
MGESFQRIVAWAKAHPALSVGIVAALGVIGYLIYKHVPTGSSLPANTADTGLTTGGGGSASLLGDPSTYMNGTLPPVVQETITTTSSGDSSGDSGSSIVQLKEAVETTQKRQRTPSEATETTVKNIPVVVITNPNKESTTTGEQKATQASTIITQHAGSGGV